MAHLAVLVLAASATGAMGAAEVPLFVGGSVPMGATVAASGSVSLSWGEARSALAAPEPHAPVAALSHQLQVKQQQVNQVKQQQQVLGASSGSLSFASLFPASPSPFKLPSLALIVESCSSAAAATPALPNELEFSLPANHDDIANFVSLISNNPNSVADFWSPSMLPQDANSKTDSKGPSNIAHLRERFCGGDCGALVDDAFLLQLSMLDRAASALETGAINPKRIAVTLKNPWDSQTGNLAKDQNLPIVLQKVRRAKLDITQKFISAFIKTHGTDATVARLCIPPSVFPDQTAPSRIVKRAIPTNCVTSLAACQSMSNNCSSHGVCVSKPSPGNPGTFCFTCSCTLKAWTDDLGKPIPRYGPVTWTGSACQYQDVSASFHILFWFVVASIVLLVFSIGMLYDLGDPSANGNGAPASRPKTD